MLKYIRIDTFNFWSSQKIKSLGQWNRNISTVTSIRIYYLSVFLLVSMTLEKLDNCMRAPEGFCCVVTMQPNTAKHAIYGFLFDQTANPSRKTCTCILTIFLLVLFRYLTWHIIMISFVLYKNSSPHLLLFHISKHIYLTLS